MVGFVLVAIARLLTRASRSRNGGRFGRFLRSALKVNFNLNSSALKEEKKKGKRKEQNVKCTLDDLCSIFDLDLFGESYWISFNASTRLAPEQQGTARTYQYARPGQRKLV
jgi:hypothetical protein